MRLILIILITTVVFSVFAQEPYRGYGLDRRYPGGEIALMKFIQQNLKYPDSAIAYGIQGKVMVKLKILSNGSVDSVHVVSHLNKYLEEEAVRVFELLQFVPTKVDTLSPLYLTMPIAFKLN